MRAPPHLGVEQKGLVLFTHLLAQLFEDPTVQVLRFYKVHDLHCLVEHRLQAVWQRYGGNGVAVDNAMVS